MKNSYLVNAINQFAAQIRQIALKLQVCEKNINLFIRNEIQTSSSISLNQCDKDEQKKIISQKCTKNYLHLTSLNSESFFPIKEAILLNTKEINDLKSRILQYEEGVQNRLSSVQTAINLLTKVTYLNDRNDKQTDKDQMIRSSKCQSTSKKKEQFKKRQITGSKYNWL